MAKKEPDRARFGRQLKRMRNAAGWSQDRLASEMSRVDPENITYTRDSFAKVETGESGVGDEIRWVLLLVFAGERFGLPEPQDALRWVGYIGGDLARRELHELYPRYTAATIDAAVRQPGGRLPGGKAFVPRLPKTAICRGIQQDIIQLIVGIGKDEETRKRGVILYGAAGVGKTGLATAIARDDRIADVFSFGIRRMDLNFILKFIMHLFFLAGANN